MVEFKQNLSQTKEIFVITSKRISENIHFLHDIKIQVNIYFDCF